MAAKATAESKLVRVIFLPFSKGFRRTSDKASVEIPRMALVVATMVVLEGT
jgi:hypothetical protein